MTHTYDKTIFTGLISLWLVVHCFNPNRLRVCPAGSSNCPLPTPTEAVVEPAGDDETMTESSAIDRHYRNRAAGKLQRSANEDR